MPVPKPSAKASLGYVSDHTIAPFIYHSLSTQHRAIIVNIRPQYYWLKAARFVLYGQIKQGESWALRHAKPWRAVRRRASDCRRPFGRRVPHAECSCLSASKARVQSVAPHDPRTLNVPSSPRSFQVAAYSLRSRRVEILIHVSVQARKSMAILAASWPASKISSAWSRASDAGGAGKRWMSGAYW